MGTLVDVDAQAMYASTVQYQVLVSITWLPPNTTVTLMSNITSFSPTLLDRNSPSSLANVYPGLAWVFWVVTLSTSIVCAPAVGFNNGTDQMVDIICQHCGNGIRDIGEDCDDGDSDDSNGCSNQCVVNPLFSCVPSGFGIRSICTRLRIIPLGRHTCLLRLGRVYCWGRGAEGELGTGTYTNVGNGAGLHMSSLSPISFSDPAAIVTQLHGEEHTCVTFSSGTGQCWGYNNGGQLGDGSVTNRATLGSSVVGSSPVLRGLISTFKTVCAVTRNQTVLCWGASSFNYGQLGRGDGLTPITFAASHVVSFSESQSVMIQLAGSGDTYCALFSNSRARCWGYQSNEVASVAYGQLGQGHTRLFVGTAASDMPSINFISFAESSAKIVQLSDGYWHKCALFSNGGIRCWGQGLYGQLGTGLTLAVGTSPTHMSNLAYIAFGTTDKALFVTGGRWHTCALFELGRIRCWGNNAAGQLGLGSTVNYIAPMTSLTFLNFSDTLPALQLNAGSHHNCAVFENHRVRCKKR